VDVIVDEGMVVDIGNLGIEYIKLFCIIGALGIDRILR
jgi:hypothetical protein